MQLDVLADEGDGELAHGALEPLHQLRPVLEVPLAGLDVQHFEDVVSQAIALQHQRHLIDAGHGEEGDDTTTLHVAEERYLRLQLVGDGPVAAADDHVGLDAHAAQLAHAVLGGLRLQLAGGADVRQQRHVDGEGGVAALLLAHLANRLEEGLALDVADGAAHLDDDDVGAALAADGANARLDLVRDVRDRLDRAAQEVSPALPGQHGLVDLAGGDGAAAGQIGVQEAFVVAQVQVGLGAIGGDEDLAVLVGGHGAGVNVEVGIELLDGD